jgi:hypothetical protein
MTEVVALTHADDRLVRRPSRKTVGRETVRAAVMRDLEDLDLSQRARSEHLPLHVTLGIASEHHVKGSAAEREDHTRVVGVEVARCLRRRPQHLHGRAAHTPPVTRHECTHRRVRALP